MTDKNNLLMSFIPTFRGFHQVLVVLSDLLVPVRVNLRLNIQRYIFIYKCSCNCIKQHSLCYCKCFMNCQINTLIN